MDEIFSTDIIRIPYLAHVIQLCVKVLIKVLKIDSKNENKEAGPANDKPIVVEQPAPCAKTTQKTA
jgi:hypothetical protein